MGMSRNIDNKAMAILRPRGGSAHPLRLTGPLPRTEADILGHETEINLVAHFYQKSELLSIEFKKKPRDFI